MKKILLAVLLGSATLAYGQVEDDEWGWNERPQHFEDYVTDHNGTHRMPLKVGSHEQAALQSEGNPNVPVVLVNFADRKFTLGNCDSIPDSLVTDSMVNAYYVKYCNGDCNFTFYKGAGSYGSIRDYFIDVSDSIFRPDFAVIGPVTLDKSYAYYGYSTQKGNDPRYSEFRRDVLNKVVKEKIYWPLFDNDGNGTVDMVFFLFAGWGESNTGGLDMNAIWAKESTSPTTVNYTEMDGSEATVTFATSACCHELRVSGSNKTWFYDADGNLTKEQTDSQGNSNKLAGFGNISADGKTLSGGEKPDGIGVFVHELSHALGLPDFYDTNSVGFGMDYWSVMDYGEYSGNCYCPCHYTGYEQSFMQWKELVELTEPQIVTMQPLAAGGASYKITNQANPNEYYVLDNRQSVGWDTDLCKLGHGLQVTHVDYNQSKWTSNSVNTDKDHQRMTIIAANNNYHGSNASSSLAEWIACVVGNLYPSAYEGGAYNYNLTDESTPAAAVYTPVNGAYFMGQPIRNITENADKSITFCFRTNGQLAVPQLNEVSAVSETGFEASWGSVENATRYVVEMLEEGATEAVRDTLDDVLSTSRSYTGLEPGTAYKFRVKAMANTPEDYLDSEWSEYVETKTDPTFISSLSESENFVAIYSTNGMPVANCMADRISCLDLHPGVYVVKYKNGATRKVMVR